MCLHWIETLLASAERAGDSNIYIFIRQVALLAFRGAVIY